MELNKTKNTEKLAIGLILVLSVVVFGSILYVGFSAANTEIAVMDHSSDDRFDSTLYRDHGFLIANNPVESVRRGDIEYVPCWMPREPPVIRDGMIGDRGPEPVYGLYSPLDFN